ESRTEDRAHAQPRDRRPRVGARRAPGRPARGGPRRRVALDRCRGLRRAAGHAGPRQGRRPARGRPAAAPL
ncbi:MAG: hypothetical protein AVDCRST_MAG54-2120, partial [uncultured Actinomycetospora sp.]